MDNALYNNILNEKQIENNRILYNNNMYSLTQRYDRQYVKLINQISSIIAKFYTIFKKLINDVGNISITLGNQTIYSKSILLEINKNNEKLFQLNDRVEMINDAKKLLDNNLSIINNNLNIFISEIKKKFKDIKKLRNQKINQIFLINKDIPFINSMSNEELNNKEIILRSNSNSNYFNSYNNNYSSRNNISSEKFMKNLKQSNFDSNSPKNNYHNVENVLRGNYLSPSPYLNRNNKYNNRKRHLNKSQEIIQTTDKNYNQIKSKTIRNENISRNEDKIIKRTNLCKNNSCLSIKSTIDMSNQNKKYFPDKNQILYTDKKKNDINIIELQLANGIIQFISILNNIQININKNLNSKFNYEKMKNNLFKLAQEVIKGNNNCNNINKNIINNNFIYNDKKNENILNSKDLIKEINQTKKKNKDLEILIRIKEKENQKLKNEFKERSNNLKVVSNSILMNKIKEISEENKNNLIKIKSLEEENKLLKDNNDKKINSKSPSNELIESENEKEKDNEKKSINKNMMVDIENRIIVNIKGIEKKNEINIDEMKEYKNKCYLLEKDKNGLRNELEKQTNKIDEINLSYKNLENKYGIIDLQKRQLTQKVKNYEKEIEELKNKIKNYENDIDEFKKKEKDDKDKIKDK